MRLATLRLPGRTAAVRLLDDTTAVELPARDLGALLAGADWRAVAAGDGPHHTITDLAQPVLTAGSRTWHVSGHGRPVPVDAPVPELAAWLIGRRRPASFPALPPWL